MLSIADVIDCPARYPNGNTMTFDDGTMRYQNGNTLRFSDGTMRYMNGNTLRFSDGTMRYQNGNTLRFTDGTMRYINGNTLRFSDGTLRDINGNTNHTGSITLSTDFNDSKMRISVRSNSEEYQASLPYGDGIVVLEFDGRGNVTCTVEGANGPGEFKITGKHGSAYVTVKDESESRKIKEAIQRVLDGN